MSIVKTAADISVFTVGTSGSPLDFVCEARNVEYSGTAEMVDGSCLGNFNETPQEVKRSGRINFTNLSTISPGTRVSHYDLTGLSVSGVSVLLQARSFTFNQEFTMEPIAGIGSQWVRNQIVKRRVTINVEADVISDAIAQSVMVAFHSGTYASRTMNFSFTINGVTITLPCRLIEVGYSIQENANQTLNLTLQGLANDSDVLFSAAPSGAGSLLAWSINQPTTQLFVTLNPATDTFTLTGNFLLESASIEVRDADLVRESYALMSQGTISAVAN